MQGEGADPRPAHWTVRGLLPFLLGLIGCCALIGRGLESRIELRLLPGSIEEKKHRLFRNHGDEYDLVFVGTSRVLRGFDPSAFDRRMEELGREMKSFNFGLVGLGFLEQVRLVNWILEQQPDRLKFLVLEPTERDVIWHIPRAKTGRRAQEVAEPSTNLFTLRDVNWHTPGVTADGVASIWSTRSGLQARLEESYLHVLHALHRAFNLGTGTNLLTRSLEESRRPAIDVDGFGGKDERLPWGQEPEERAARQDVTPPSSLLWQVLRATCERVEELGIQVLLVVPPTADPLRTLFRASESGDLDPFLAYTPEVVPELFAERESYFFDAKHLNRAGAERFSVRLAEDLLPQLQAGD